MSVSAVARRATGPDVLERVRRRLVASSQEPTPASVASALRAEGQILGNSEVLQVLEVLRCELAGFGVLDPLLRDESVTDVLVNGPEAVFVDRGGGLERVRLRLPDEQSVRRLAVRLASSSGRRLDDASPWVDARLPSGVRLHAILPPVSPRGTLISLRVPRRRAFDLDELVRSGSLTPLLAEVLRRLVQQRLAFLVVGGTGTGKTTLLAALLGLVPAHERVLLVEDTGELQPDHPHVVRLEARPANVEGAGAVSVRDLVRQALRMRPDRLVVGEVRGAEVVDLLAALNTGHEGGCGTLHANSAADVPARVEALGAAAGMERGAVHAQLASALDAVVALRRDPCGARRVAEVRVLERDREGMVAARCAVDEGGPGPAYAQLCVRLDMGAV